jgi:hypothetical protein
MRIVGSRKLPEVGLRSPTSFEIQATVENSARAPRVIPKGVYRYRNHAEANAQMEQWRVDALVERARELDGETRGRRP